MIMEEQLIDFVRKHNCLYDKSNPHYKVNSIRNKKFDELSQKTNIPAKKLKARWRTLRDTFHKEVKAEYFDGVSSTKKTWKWMEHLMFLKNANNFDASSPSPARLSSRRRREYRFAHMGEDTSTNDLTSVEEIAEAKDELSQEMKDDYDDEQTSTFPTPERDIKPTFEEVTNESGNQMPANCILVRHDDKLNPSSAIQLFFAGLAKQTEDANITAREFAQLQMKLLKVFNKEVYDV